MGKEKGRMKITVTYDIPLEGFRDFITQTVTVENDLKELPPYNQFLEDYIRPLSLALGYQPVTVDAYLGES